MTGESDSESAPLSGSALDPYCSSVKFYNFFYKGEPESAAFCGVREVVLIKLVKYFPAGFGTDSFPFIPDLK